FLAKKLAKHLAKKQAES
uniref:Short cationic peptide-5a n=1 Tax=Cupiennius salei TaxID=6928 RepID=TXS5A_CUPSA|nr:RecName: Full=Short cationic peptide-5a; Short=SCP-5a; AltName: Full=Short cationic peptide-7b; Short=SCP-7b; AltName: Full=Truncated variant of Cupiennin 5 family [Cupiennius salei]